LLIISSPVFTAALVISARLLESIQIDLAATYHLKKMLKKAEKVFQHLDSENSLVLSCWRYIHELSNMCDYRGKSYFLSLRSPFLNDD
jgi:hypothetical protein